MGQNTINTGDTVGSRRTLENKDMNPSGCGEDDEELRRYGYWSAEAQSIALPSYRSAFLFLARVPLELIHEFLRLRLEQKPDQPSVLSIRQLMREFKAGLRIAVFHRQRYLHLIRTALWDVDNTIMTTFEDGIIEFDQSMKSILEVYLNYLQQWVQMVQQESSHKNLLEEEWCFVKLTCPSIPGGEGLAGNSFCGMAMDMLRAIGDHLGSKVEQVTKDMNNGELFEDDCSPKQGMLFVCREFQGLFNDDRERALKAVSFAKALKKDLETCDISQEHQPTCCSIITDSLDKLKNEALSLCDKITRTILSVEKICDVREGCTELEEMDKAALFSRCREILHLGYKFGFEYHKEVCRLVIKEASTTLSRYLISFARRWMHFVKHWCEKGRGLRPRWSNQGLDFLMTVCEPQHTRHLGDEEFEELKNSIAECISHVIGTAVPGNQNQVHTPPYHHSSRSSLESRSRGTSPSPHSRSTALHFRSSRSLQDAAGGNGGPTPTQRSLSVQTNPPAGSCLLSDSEHHIGELVVQSLAGSLRVLTRSERMQAAVKQLDAELEQGLREQELIGSIVDLEEENKIHIKPRGVTFGWQRGIKIGQGRFGKVYTAVNNQTGELMAMKEIQLQPNDHRTIRKVTEELRIFECIQHNTLVRYYGVEIHREEMLIFMEFCAEGTLESLVAATECGLPEALIRRYTHQLLQAVCVLHHHGIVHRDIKSANIFLTQEGNCLKLGDFGSAVKLKSHTTLPGELEGFVGTQAYMAPEVFMKTGTEGHGRTADIWSAGCVVVEMASGKRPWPEFDSNYQIMFKVGMGESPVAPSSLSNEGHEFLALCLQHDPKHRSSAFDLLHHTFVKVDMDEDLPSIFGDHLKLNAKR